ncbi:MAG: REP-associated tyrosine transposase [Bryobacteraceae bacterium]
MRSAVPGMHYDCMHVSERRLPHRYTIGQALFVTFRLHGSLPPGRVFRGGRLTSGKAFVCMDRLLDEQRSGPAYLRLPEIAEVVVHSIRGGAERDYLLHSWVVMPNHVHLLITPWIDAPVLLRRMKGVSAREANQLLKRTGQAFWQDESYDRLVRSPEEFQRIQNYIIQNPVRAELVQSAEQYPWSSAATAG